MDGRRMCALLLFGGLCGKGAFLIVEEWSFLIPRRSDSTEVSCDCGGGPNNCSKKNNTIIINFVHYNKTE